MNAAIWGGGSKGAGYRGGGKTVCAPTAAEAVLGGLDYVRVTYADCYAVHNGSVAFSGGNVTGVVGQGFRSTYILQPRIIPIREPVQHLAVAGARWLALGAESGQPITCGSNVYGQIGDGTSGEGHEQNGSPVPVYLSVPYQLEAVVAGGGTNGLLTRDGQVLTWGEGKRGQLGYGIMLEQRVPKVVPGLSNIVALDIGGDSSVTGHALALDGDGYVWAWGDNNSGQSAVAPTQSEVYRHGHVVLTPTLVVGLPPIVAVAAGANHSLALDTEGNVWGWGNGLEGQLAGYNGYIPTKLGIVNAKAISAGLFFSMVLYADGSAAIFGSNQHGVQFSTEEQVAIPTLIGLNGVEFVDAGEWSAAVTCAGSVPGPRAELHAGPGTLKLTFIREPGAKYVAAFRSQTATSAEREEWSEANKTIVTPDLPAEVEWSKLEPGPYEVMVRGPGLAEMVFEGLVL